MLEESKLKEATWYVLGFLSGPRDKGCGLRGDPEFVELAIKRASDLYALSDEQDERLYKMFNVKKDGAK